VYLIFLSSSDIEERLKVVVYRMRRVVTAIVDDVDEVY